MLTYSLKKAPGVPLYEALYRCIRADILSGVLECGQKLPSKRALAEHLEISKITVEAAYNQLLSEGYIRAREKVGYFVESVEHLPPQQQSTAAVIPEESAPPLLDLTGGGTEGFPFSVWSRLQREVMLDYGEKLLLPMPNRGVAELRQAIAENLRQFRGMQVDPDNILIGAGGDFLYNLLIQLLGRDMTYAVEEPGYGKIRRIYDAAGVAVRSAPMDHKGVLPHKLEDARVLHISPSHHFPTGLVTPMTRRRELLEWADRQNAWLIEDDYDSEFRFHSHPVPALLAMDRWGKVIYMNTFSKTLAPSIRISYMILPPGLMEEFRRKLGFYSCTVPSFEQYTLARFLSGGWFEKHINRMRKFYRTRRNRVIGMLEQSPFAGRMTILEQDAGLHFLLRVDTPRSDRELKELCARAGIRVRCLGDYFAGETPPWAEKCLIINYSGLDEEKLPAALERLGTLVTES